MARIKGLTHVFALAMVSLAGWLVAHPDLVAAAGKKHPIVTVISAAIVGVVGIYWPSQHSSEPGINPTKYQ